MKLHREDFGTAGGVPLVLVHGLMGQGRNLAGIARAMARDRHVITVDLRNHGQSPWDNLHDYPSMAADIFETLDAFSQIDMMGHSMGGKAAMFLSLTRPEWIRRAMIVDIAPVAYSHSHSADIAALMALDLAGFDRRGAVDAALATAIPDAGMRAFFLHGLVLTPTKRWLNNLAVLRDNMALITGWPEIDALSDVSVQVVYGTNSDYIDAHGRAKIKTLFSNASFVAVEGAGHWLHVEKPREFDSILRDYFS